MRYSSPFEILFTLAIIFVSTTSDRQACLGVKSTTGSVILAPTNQDYSISSQLNNGVRGLTLDMYDFNNDIWLCRGKCVSNAKEWWRLANIEQYGAEKRKVTRIHFKSRQGGISRNCLSVELCLKVACENGGMEARLCPNRAEPSSMNTTSKSLANMIGETVNCPKGKGGLPFTLWQHIVH
ncbi:hypothetical protein FEM48_Zijuj09G0123800 [Ziziphus jujuba var. spinosa]|uniref:Uncharacterized protein n=1 Tax=Ziziphus jujuba var. spinosa TaxID=714518 RepID=A0A978USZ5_ZIZJJ|nr:hypothetical protein FEM48_Zijuj09G0123800 [Ziziphus jujuba var. spinosa]